MFTRFSNVDMYGYFDRVYYQQDLQFIPYDQAERLDDDDLNLWYTDELQRWQEPQDYELMYFYEKYMEGEGFSNFGDSLPYSATVFSDSYLEDLYQLQSLMFVKTFEQKFPFPTSTLDVKTPSVTNMLRVHDIIFPSATSPKHF